MLVFASPVPSAVAQEAVRADGLFPRDGKDTLTLHMDLGDVPRGADRVYVVDTTALPEPPKRASGQTLQVPHVPPAAICNLNPYLEPEIVKAGGGYVTRRVDGDVVLLLIHRRGVWDLPKGKLDPGETIEECALREVKEEVGIGNLALRHPLGTTHHAYPDGDAYAVKVTHWYLMETPERSFEPERREGIRRVAWARWPVARRHIGYETLARHMDRIAPTVQSEVG